MKLKEKLFLAGARIVAPLAQIQAHHNPEKTVTPGMPELLRSAAAQGAVLLENRVLPLKEGTTVSLFGRIQSDWFCTGYGSGGDVNAPYRVSLLEGLMHCQSLRVNRELAEIYKAWIQQNPANHGVWGMWPRSHPEMPLTEETVSRARKGSDAAVVVIGRSSGEDRENVLEPGSYYLTEEERQMLQLVTRHFPDAVLVLNIGSLMDLSFLEDFSFGAVLIAWQGGMESGIAVADLLCGRETPCGCLPDTVARRYEDCPTHGYFGAAKANEYWEDIYVGYRYFETFAPEQVRYPFGYGLSYTHFETVLLPEEDPFTQRLQVRNAGDYAGRCTPMVFVEKPASDLGSPARELIAFQKTGLLAPGQSQEVTLTWQERDLAVYDDNTMSPTANAWILVPGEYHFYIGANVRDAQKVATWNCPETKILKKCEEAAAPAVPFPILARENGEKVTRMASARKTDLARRILQRQENDIFMTGDRGYKLKDVKEGRVSLQDFIGQLSLEELEAISRGAYTMGHPLGAKGNAGIFGGVTESLRAKGVPPATTTDGPSGIRLYDSCSLLPIGTLLASTFDTHLVEEIYRRVGQEMRERGSDVLLAPGMNIHRDPLCGRNFEYFSEDPLLTGRMAAAVVRGVQSQGLAACPKHYACNSQETNRNKTDSILSQRALREIYLRGFEICVTEADPKTLMTSYNKINGVWGHYHYDLVQTILRRDWGFRGMVMTDWWMQYAPSPEFPKLTGNGYRVRSGVDVLMPGSRSFMDRRKKPDGTLLSTYKKPQGITLGEMQTAAGNVLRCIMELKEL